MKQAEYQHYLTLLREEISPALGCTEPAAAALCAAQAAQLLGEPVQQLTIEVSAYILKNAMNVGIPGTKETGLPMAAAMGAVSAAPQQKLLVLHGLNEAQIGQARQLVKTGQVTVRLCDGPEKVYVKAIVSGACSTAAAAICQSHTQFVYLERDGQILLDHRPQASAAQENTAGDTDLTVHGILRFAAEARIEDLSFLKELVRINSEIAREGLAGQYGLGVGKGLTHPAGPSWQSASEYAICLTSAAADARMAGCEKPVMSVAGSGNQGLTATLPIIALAEWENCTDEQLYRSLAVSILVTIHTKQFIGRLSVLCGCAIAAAIGVVSGVSVLHGGDEAAVVRGIRTMVADISGMVCDGAKPGCALKIATSVSAALRAAELAMAGQGATERDGIVDADVEKTLYNLGELGLRGMSDTNATILEMLLCKKQTSIV